ncbi:regulatory-associated protein of TOR 2 isoform X2 [Iris pallida]|uniref:Regulatory-associated protein of TOR 2 isoform X2 n=1 Tax=Iris pallida TaxID=29817 RepID=A0AAX6F159_IRIPA|nr:regulatory-associated protein of TOR 2 isoform X2 [Iris pallida]
MCHLLLPPRFGCGVREIAGEPSWKRQGITTAIPFLPPPYMSQLRGAASQRRLWKQHRASSKPL